MALSFDFREEAEAPEGTLKGDLCEWELNLIPLVLREMPRGYLLREGEFGWDAGLRSLVDIMENGNKDEQEDAKLKIERGFYTFINLMRMSCGLEVSMEPIQHWSDEDKAAEPWGNEFTASYVRKVVSPHPAWTYRMVEAHWPMVAKGLVFWSPDLNPDFDSGKVEQIEVNSGKRKRALEMVAKVGRLFDKMKEKDKPAPKKRLKRGEVPDVIKERSGKAVAEK